MLKEAQKKSRRKGQAKEVTNGQKPTTNEQPLRVVVELVPDRLSVVQAIKYLLTVPRETNGPADAVSRGEGTPPQ
jgi:hypothetical protein